jgi:hypothetical protein
MLNSALPFLTLVAVVLVPVTAETSRDSPHPHQREAQVHAAAAECRLVGRQIVEYLTPALG